MQSKRTGGAKMCRIPWPLSVVAGVGYVMSIMLARRIAEVMTNQAPKRGRLVEYPDELGFWWVEEDEDE